MKIKKIHVSQPAPANLEKSPFNELIEKYKLKIDFQPFIKVEPVTAKEFRSQRVDVLSYSAVIFSSRGNIDNFFKVNEENRVVIPEEMKYFCTTEAIALYLQKYIVYRKRKIFYGKGSFADLMAIITKHKEEKFLLAVTEPHKPEIELGLEKAKVKFQTIVLAHTVTAPVKGQVDLKNYDLMVFYSPSEIKSLTDNFGDKAKNAKTLYATFGTGTASAAVEAGIEVSVLAPTKNCPSMIMALSNFIKEVNSGETPDTTYITKAIAEANALKEMVISKVKPVKKESATKSRATATTTAVKAKKSSESNATTTTIKRTTTKRAVKVL